MTTPTNNQPTTLPGRYFTDEEIYERESERIFSREWIYVGRESSIKEAGEFFVHTQGKERIIIVRDPAGEVRAFYDLCRHRGTGLCSSQYGAQPEWTWGKVADLLGHIWVPVVVLGVGGIDLPIP